MRNKLNPHSPWPERDAELTEIWNWRGPNCEHHSQAQVARKMGLSKGTVCGRARRLGLYCLATDRALVPPANPPRSTRLPDEEPLQSIVRISRRRALVRNSSMEQFREVEITEDFGRLPHMEPAQRKPPAHKAPSHVFSVTSTLPPLPSLRSLE